MSRQELVALLLLVVIISHKSLYAGPLARSFARRQERPVRTHFHLLHGKASETVLRPEIKEGNFTFELLDIVSGRDEVFKVNLTATSLHAAETRIEGTIFAIESTAEFFAEYKHLALYRHNPLSPYSITFIAGAVKGSTIEVEDLEFQSILSSVNGSFMLAGDHGGSTVEGYLYGEEAVDVFVPEDVKGLTRKYLAAIMEEDFQRAQEISASVDDATTFKHLSKLLRNNDHYEIKIRKFAPNPEDYFISIFCYIDEGGRRVPIQIPLIIDFHKDEEGQLKLHYIDE